MGGLRAAASLRPSPDTTRRLGFISADPADLDRIMRRGMPTRGGVCNLLLSERQWNGQ